MSCGVGGASAYGADHPRDDASSHSPVTTVSNWFEAIDEHDPDAIDKFYAPDAQRMPLTDLDTTTYSKVRCRVTRYQRTTETSSVVRCTFTVTTPTVSMTGIHFWTVWLKRRSPGPWLITSYGQG